MWSRRRCERQGLETPFNTFQYLTNTKGEVRATKGGLNTLEDEVEEVMRDGASKGCEEGNIDEVSEEETWCTLCQ